MKSWDEFTELKPFAVHFAGMHRAICELPDAKLAALRDECAQVSRSNCWWATYDAGKSLRAVVDAEIKSRQSKAKATANALSQQQGGRDDGN